MDNFKMGVIEMKPEALLASVELTVVYLKSKC